MDWASFSANGLKFVEFLKKFEKLSFGFRKNQQPKAKKGCFSMSLKGGQKKKFFDFSSFLLKYLENIENFEGNQLPFFKEFEGGGKKKNSLIFQAFC